MKILQPHVIAIRRNYLPALKVEYSTSAHQSSFRIQIYRIQVSLKRYSNHILKKYGNTINVFPWSVLSVVCWTRVFDAFYFLNFVILVRFYN